MSRDVQMIWKTLGACCALALFLGCGSARPTSQHSASAPSVLDNVSRDAPIRVFSELVNWVERQAGPGAAARLVTDQPALARWAVVRATMDNGFPPAQLGGLPVPVITPTERATLAARWQRWINGTLTTADQRPLSSALRRHDAIRQVDDHIQVVALLMQKSTLPTDHPSPLAGCTAGADAWPSLNADPLALLDAIRLADLGMLPTAPAATILAGAHLLADLAQPLAALPLAHQAARQLADGDLLRAALLLDLGRTNEARDSALASAERWRGQDRQRTCAALTIAAACAWRRGQVAACDALLASAEHVIAGSPTPVALLNARRGRELAGATEVSTHLTTAALLGVDPSQAGWTEWVTAGRIHRQWLGP